MSFPNFVAHIRKFVPLSEEEAVLLKKYVRVESLKKKGLLLEEGQICRSLYFVERGCLRLYYINDKGSERTIQFAIENWWISDYASFQNQSPSEFYIQTVEPATVVVLDHSAQEAMFKALPQLHNYFYAILQKAFATAQQRIKYMFDFSREEIFFHFSAHYPEFLQRVPQYMLASYLGLSPEYLSELRKKKNGS